MKIALLADLHFGVKKSDQTFQQSQLRFLKGQFINEIKEQGIDTIVICGDVFDTRQSVNVQTQNVVIDWFKNALNDFNVHIIVGNHDMYTTNSTEVNSLKMIDLLPNVTVYETPTKTIIGNKEVLMLPWVTDYSQFDTLLLENYHTAFAHLDIVGFDMGGRLSEGGLTIKDVMSKIDNTYTGHYHSRSHREFNGKTITYVGSPYQITRIDKGTERGYGVLDLDTDAFNWHDNMESMKFIEFIYPDYDTNLVKGNVIDLKIPFEKQNETKKIYDLVQKLEKFEPAYPINVFNMENTENQQEIEIDVNSLNLTNLFKSYIEQLDTELNKDELYSKLTELYDLFKGVNNG